MTKKLVEYEEILDQLGSPFEKGSGPSWETSTDCKALSVKWTLFTLFKRQDEGEPPEEHQLENIINQHFHDVGICDRLGKELVDKARTLNEDVNKSNRSSCIAIFGPTCDN